MAINILKMVNVMSKKGISNPHHTPTAETRNQAKQWFMVGCSYKFVAAKFCIHRDTVVFHYEGEYNLAKGELAANLFTKLYKFGSEGDTRALIYLAEKLCPMYFNSEIKEVEQAKSNITLDNLTKKEKDTMHKLMIKAASKKKD